MSPQTIAECIILNGRLRVGSVFSPLFPSFYILIFDISKVASVLAMSYFSVQDSAPYVANGLMKILKVSFVFLLIKLYFLLQENCKLCVICVCNTFYNISY
jgi:hypothetical protein